MPRGGYNFQDLSGKTFSRLYVLWQGPHGNQGQVRWWCTCACGKTILVAAGHLRSKWTKSCGCFESEKLTKRNTTHGKSERPEYNIWAHILGRCLNATDTAFKNYGGRGITICERWRNSFQTFLDDMGPKPTPRHSIERVVNDGNYEPDNCIWALPVQQARNTRSNHLLTCAGRTQCLAAWLEETGISKSTLKYRLKHGWSVEKALTTPLGSQGFHSYRYIAKNQ